MKLLTQAQTRELDHIMLLVEQGKTQVATKELRKFLKDNGYRLRTTNDRPERRRRKTGANP